MSSKSPKSFSFSEVYCSIFGHQLKVSKNVTNHIHEYECAKCGMEMTDTAHGFLAKLTPKFKETNAYLASFHERRRRRSRQRQVVNAS
ncbi:hypothetical protein JM83_1393 [Gillisia sp. Hel_I_86]|uniref:hypothetical protein n=1 Tax=Gillisia sp. Hel_I_86 TaxID=1249981 RepID=UPI0011996374|nr:hypothetical protein [Gillisia sp. Hel_I_86]TVZ26435.1 hypothetical protein JM83_1393 [Gillisia sp. Hel_I_86]